MTETLDLPMIINGRVIRTEDRERLHVLSYENGLKVRIPVMEPADLARIQDERRDVARALVRLSTDEVTRFLGKCGDRWLQRGTQGSRLAHAYGHQITGFPAGFLHADYATIGNFMVVRHHLWDTIEARWRWQTCRSRRQDRPRARTAACSWPRWWSGRRSR